MILKDIMSPIRSCLLPSDSLRTAIRYMKESKFEIIPVTDESQRLIGVFTRPILYQILLDGLSLETPIRSCMKRDAVALPFDTPYEDIGEIVKDSKVGTGIVLDHDRRVMGLFTKTDMIMSLFRMSQSLKEQLEAVLHFTHLGAFVTDEEENILFVNEVLCKMLGKEPENLIGLPLRTVLPNIKFSPDLVKKSGRVQIGQIRTVMRLSRYTTINGHSGLIGLFQDVSDLEEMAEELEMVKKWQKLLDTTIEHAYDGLVMVNEKGEIIFLNRPMAELFGLDKEVCIGKPLKEVLPQLELIRALETGVAELSDVLESNGIRYLVQSIPVIQDGRIIGAIGKVLFRQLHEVRDVLRRLDVLENQVAYYKEQVKHVNSARFTFDHSDTGLVVCDADYGELIEEARSDLPAVEQVIVVGTPTVQRHLAYERILSDSEEEPDVVVHEHDDLEILYTSGTTGRPKGALFDHRRIMQVGIKMMAVLGLVTNDRLLHLAPLFHSAQLNLLLLPGFFLGTGHVIQRDFHPLETMKAIQEHKITFFFGVPAMYTYLLQVPNREQFDLSTVSRCAYGAAPMAPEIVKQSMEMFGTDQFYNLCGLTEAGPGGICLTPEDHKTKLGASGLTMFHTEARVVDDVDEDVPPGKVGELVLRGETLMKGYRWLTGKKT
ncbi:AMP-binding protein [Effusibacillus consociatus]|uniref:AMP-binding protein n=1 Tax=Effusibacillus consociatus TaxID=1117041 RepID=A0ABV9Q1L1_9BACL